MEKRLGIVGFAVVCEFCILFCVGPAFAVTVPEKLKDIPLFQKDKLRFQVGIQTEKAPRSSPSQMIDPTPDLRPT